MPIKQAATFTFTSMLTVRLRFTAFLLRATRVTQIEGNVEYLYCALAGARPHPR